MKHAKIKDVELLDYDFKRGKEQLKLKVVLTTFNDIPKIDIREFYLDVNGEYKHSKRGIQLDPQKAEAVRNALAKNDEIIDDHLIGEDATHWLENVKKIEAKAESFSQYEIFRSVSTGTKEEIIFNTNHPFGKKITKLLNSENGEVKEIAALLNALLISYAHTLSHIDKSTKIEAEDLLEDLNTRWSVILKRLIS